jgi:hypothetical protein
VTRARRLVAVAVAAAALSAGTASPASAFNPLKPVCGVASLASGIAGKACAVAQNAGRFAKAGKQLLTGHVGSAVKTALGGSGGTAARAASTAIGLAAVGTWVLGGAKSALRETAKVIGQTTSPQLRTTWFSSTYWRVAGIAAVLTMPFLFAAAIQALMAADVTLLARAALGYLPLAMLAVSVAAPLTMLLLAASDQMSSIVSSAAGDASVHFLDKATVSIGVLTAADGSPFLAFLVGVFVVGAALVLWLELLMREAAVYVIVLMLPLAFAAMVWPARRIWAIRAVELLIALILSKFAIVAVLSLGAAAMGHSFEHGITGFLAAAVLLLLGAFTPWALLRLIPLTELATGAAASLRGEARAIRPARQSAQGAAQIGDEWATGALAEMSREAFDTAPRAAAPRVADGVGSRALEMRRDAGAPDGSERALDETDPPASQPSNPAPPDRQAAPDPEPAAPPERIPGMSEMWQQPNFSWPVIYLGPEEEAPPAPDPGPAPPAPGADPEPPAPHPEADAAPPPLPAEDGRP